MSRSRAYRAEESKNQRINNDAFTAAWKSTHCATCNHPFIVGEDKKPTMMLNTDTGQMLLVGVQCMPCFKVNPLQGLPKELFNDFVTDIDRCMHCNQPLPIADAKHVVTFFGMPDMPWVFCLPCWQTVEPLRGDKVIVFLAECAYIPKANEPSATDGTAPRTPPTNETDR